jgi:hypothetical protein
LLIETAFEPFGQVPLDDAPTTTPLADCTHTLTDVVVCSDASAAATAMQVPPTTAAAPIPTSTAIRIRAVTSRMLYRMH